MARRRASQKPVPALREPTLTVVWDGTHGWRNTPSRGQMFVPAEQKPVAIAPTRSRRELGLPRRILDVLAETTKAMSLGEVRRRVNLTGVPVEALPVSGALYKLVRLGLVKRTPLAKPAGARGPRNVHGYRLTRRES